MLEWIESQLISTAIFYVNNIKYYKHLLSES